MTEPTKLPIGEAIEVLYQHASDSFHADISPTLHIPRIERLRAALAAFGGWGEPIKTEWLLEQLKSIDGELFWAEITDGMAEVHVRRDDHGWYARVRDGDREVHLRYVENRGDLLGLLHYLGVEDEGVGG